MIQAKTLFRAALLAILVLFGSLAVNVAVPTSATALPLVYGNVVIEGYGSTANLLVVGTGSSTFRGMRPNTSSDSWPAFVRNVRAFYVPPGYTAVSRYGYGYASGWHPTTVGFFAPKSVHHVRFPFLPDRSCHVASHAYIHSRHFDVGICRLLPNHPICPRAAW
jgi:hypothetical protein